MAHSDFCEYILELLEPLGRVTAKRMFGGYGLYLDRVIFAIIADDMLWLKADGENRPVFEKLGMRQFMPRLKNKTMAMPYFSVNAEYLEEAEKLLPLARLALKAGLRSAYARKKDKK